MPRNPKDPKAEQKPKRTTKDITKAMEESKRVTEEATKKAIEAIMRNKTVDLPEGSSAQPSLPKFYNELFQKDPPSAIKPTSVYLQTPIQFQSSQRDTTGLTTPAKRLTLAEGSTSKKSKTDQDHEEVSSDEEYNNNH